jgi:predicted DNA-binding ribbon-helix-helix protein
VRDDAAIVPREGLLLSLSTEDLEPEFRVVARGGVRRGIRLERFFWISLKKLAESRKSTLGKVIEEIAETHAGAGNLTSAIRVACIRWLSDKNTDLQKLASLKTINAILVACPSPAFALSSSKKILTFNPPFQQLVRRQLPVGHGDDARQDLKLALDLNVADICSRLDANGENPVVTGFVIGAGDRRYRGQLSVVRAPLIEPELLMAFVFNS